jgi:hypothetical protein
MTRAQKLVERMRRTKHGWRPSEVRAAYLGYGFSVDAGRKHDLYQHRRYPDLIATMTRSDPVKPAYIEDLLKLLDDLALRERHTR